MRIAYLEDDSDQAALISRWLQHGGHNCQHFGQGRALLRSLPHESFDLYRNARSIERNGERLNLTDKEYELAVFLFLNAGRLISRRHILEAVWGLRADTKTRTVDTHMSRLRTKLGLAGEQGWRLRSVQQFGYRLELERPDTPR